MAKKGILNKVSISSKNNESISPENALVRVNILAGKDDSVGVWMDLPDKRYFGGDTDNENAVNVLLLDLPCKVVYEAENINGAWSCARIRPENPVLPLKTPEGAVTKSEARHEDTGEYDLKECLTRFVKSSADLANAIQKNFPFS
jgi:hypothetical protein